MVAKVDVYKRQPYTYHIESADEIEPSWFNDGQTVGVTAGASTPDNQIEDVIARLHSL